MKTRVVPMGRTLGVRLPKALVDEAARGEEGEVRARKGSLVIHGAAMPRQGWEEAARRLSERGEDRLIDAPIATRFDEDEWRW